MAYESNRIVKPLSSDEEQEGENVVHRRYPHFNESLGNDAPVLKMAMH